MLQKPQEFQLSENFRWREAPEYDTDPVVAGSWLWQNVALTRKTVYKFLVTLDSSSRDPKSCRYSLFCGKGETKRFFLYPFSLSRFNKGHPSSYRSIMSAILKSIKLRKMKVFS